MVAYIQKEVDGMNELDQFKPVELWNYFLNYQS